MGDTTVNTKLGTLYATFRHDNDYPGILIGLDRGGVYYEFAWVEVDQSDTDEEPVMKIHVFGTDGDDPVYDHNINLNALKKLYKEEK